MIRRSLVTLFALISAIFLVTNSSNSLAQVSKSQLDTYLDYIVSQEEDKWSFYSYQNGSMNNARILDHRGYSDSYGRFQPSMMLIKGDFVYSNFFFTSDGYVIVRINGKNVSCVSYDTSFGSDCTSDGGGVSYWWKVYEFAVAEIAGTLLKSIFGYR